MRPLNRSIFAMWIFVLALAVPVMAQEIVVPPSSSGTAFTGGAVTTPIVLPDGLITAPALAFTNAATMGLWKNGSILALQAGAPTATTGASVAGRPFTITAGAAVASTDTAGAAAGGSITAATGAAARLTSGNANGGNFNFELGAGIGTGTAGVITANGGTELPIQIGSAGYTFRAAFDNNGTATGLSVFGGGVTPSTHVGYLGITLGSDKVYKWSSSTNAVGGAYDTGLARSAPGVVKVTDGSTGIRGLLGGGTAVASATALPVPTGNVFHVTGTTTITSITSTNFQSGAVITLIFDGVLTFTDGSNLKLAGDFVTTADDVIVLTYDGSSWFENSRSVN